MPSLKVMSMDGKPIELEIDGSDTIENIKSKVTDKIGIPCRFQRLICNNIELKNDEKVSDKMKLLTQFNFTVHLTTTANITERDIQNPSDTHSIYKPKQIVAERPSRVFRPKISSNNSKICRCCKCSII